MSRRHERPRSDTAPTVSANSSASAGADDIAARAHKLHFSIYVIDTHDDTTQRFFSKSTSISASATPTGHIDIPRMREGGMNAIFFSIWIDGQTMGPQAIQKALDQIDLVRTNVAKYSKDIVLARTAEDVRRAHAQDKIAALMGVEGGHMIGNDIRMVHIFADLGVRYMTLSHFYNDRVVRFLHRQARAQRAHRFRQGNRSRNESPGNDRRYFARRRQNLLRRA